MIVQPRYYSFDQLVADLPDLPGGRARALYARDYIGDDDHVIGMFRYDGSSVRLIGSLDLTELPEVKRATVTAAADATHVTVDDASWLSVGDTLRWIDLSAGGELADTEISSIAGNDIVLATAATGIAIGDYGMRPADMVPFSIGGSSRNIEILPGATIDTDGHLQVSGGDAILWIEGPGCDGCWGGLFASITMARSTATVGQACGFGVVTQADKSEHFALGLSNNGSERAEAYYGSVTSPSTGTGIVAAAGDWRADRIGIGSEHYGGGSSFADGHLVTGARRVYVLDAPTVAGRPRGFLIRATPGGAETVTATVTEIST